MRSNNDAPLVMVVDDAEGVRRVVAMQLKVMRYRVVEAASGPEAIELAMQECPSLVLMDISMPEMDGLEAARCIREIAGMREVPIIALSALYDATETYERALAAGCNDFAGKPLEFNQLSSLVRRYLPAT